MVDDDIDFSNATAARIRSWGHKVVLCHNWLSVMVKLKNHGVDLILADVQTPTGNGLSVMEFLSEDPIIRSTPTVFLTGLNDNDTIRRCEFLNAGYLHKGSNFGPQLQKMIGQHASETCAA